MQQSTGGISRGSQYGKLELNLQQNKTDNKENKVSYVISDHKSLDRTKAGNVSLQSQIKLNKKLYNSLIFLQRRVRKYLSLKRSTTSATVKQKKTETDFNSGKELKKASFLNNKNFEYKGKRVSGEKFGFGIQTWKDGAVYKGIFQNNRANGLGLFIHADGDKYKGEFISDRASGYGIYTHLNGASYEGYWHDDCQNGIGIEKWNDGSEYQGNYIKGKKNGYGSYVWADLSRYEGEWNENNLHGWVQNLFNLGNIFFQ